MTLRSAFALSLVLAGCHDFGSAVGVCFDAGVCVDDNSSGGGAQASGGGDGSMGGGASATGGGTSASGGGTSASGGGTSAAGGGASNNPDDGGFAVFANPSALSVAPGMTAVSQISFTGPALPFHYFTMRVVAADGGRADLRTFVDVNGFIGTSPVVMALIPEPSFDAGTRDYTLQMLIEDGGMAATTALSVTVRAPAAVLLIDDDGVGANHPTQLSYVFSDEDLLFESTLRDRGVDLDRFILPFPQDGGELKPLLGSYGSVVWYTGNHYGGSQSFTRPNQDLMAPYLDGSHNFVLVSDGLFWDYDDEWDGVSNTFFRDYFGASGTDYAELDIVREMSGSGLDLAYGSSSYMVSYLKPQAPTQVLLREVSPDSGMPVATEYTTGVGSHVVFCGLTPSEIANADLDAGQRSLLNVLFDAAQIP